MTQRKTDTQSISPAFGEPLLVIESVSQSFQGLRAVSDVSLTVFAGEIVGLIGPNGSGKTTLFNLITGIYPVSQGRISFGERDLSNVPRHEMAATGIMRTFQQPRTFDRLGTVEHVLVPRISFREPIGFRGLLREMAIPWRFREETARELLAEVGLGHLNGAPAGSLPYGRRRHLEIARCLAGDPKLILLDEPTAGLNSAETRELSVLLKRIARVRATAMVVIDHDVPFIENLCARLLVMNNGNLIFDGPREEALKNPQVITAYFGVD